MKFTRLFGSPEQVERDPAAADTDKRREKNEPQIVFRKDAGKNAHAKIPTIAIRVRAVPTTAVAPEIDGDCFRG